MKMDYSVYLVTEESRDLKDLLYIVEEAVKGGATIVQLREKTSEGKLFFEKALKLKRLLDQYDVPLIINDRVDVALAVHAAGIHVGQTDLPLKAIRAIVPDSMIIGVSVSNPEEAQAAQRDGADYVGVGAAFPTASKGDATVLPPGMLEKTVQSVTIPAVAIGGINHGNITQLNHINLAGAAIVSAIMNAPSPREAAEQFRELLLARNGRKVETI
ncbi:thiamine phosphate synthase [Cytobacillus gottheilii]|uniref:Thiamine-phosphate synthase n=1 Tax=Cytobacillus gottheilii TaxID=859144 RepID=A0ABX8F632_9BACI|nr:thiamine phosphate synthase [Cytobacillus gottheilii]QVY59804.1 thiamine phosphate synthase [Cytobacillus gottheilii]